MCTFATLVLYERHGQPHIGYRAETIDQIAWGDVAEGNNGAWELRCWTSTGASPRYGVTGSELVALIGATVRVVEHCLGNGAPPDSVRRFHCAHGGAVTGLPSNQPLPEHLGDWIRGAAEMDVFLQTLSVGTNELIAIAHTLQLEIEAMAQLESELHSET